MDWNAYFAKAKKPTTLERMLMSKVEEMGVRYDPGKESLRLVADFYKRLYPSAYEMLIAAYNREQELEAANSLPATKSAKNSETKAAATPNGIQEGLEEELQDWMSRNRRANA